MNNLQKLSWQFLDVSSLSPDIVYHLKLIYLKYVQNSNTDIYLLNSLQLIKRSLTTIIDIFETYKRELLQVVDINNIVTYFSGIIEDIENENWDKVSINDLILIPSYIEEFFDESGILDLIGE